MSLAVNKYVEVVCSMWYARVCVSSHRRVVGVPGTPLPRPATGGGAAREADPRASSHARASSRRPWVAARAAAAS